MSDALPMIEVLAKLASDDWRVRRSGIVNARLAPREAMTFDLLIDALEEQDNAGLRNAAADALEAFGDDVVASLVLRIPRASADAQKFLVELLGRIRTEQATEHLAQLTNRTDLDANVRLAVLEALGRCASPRSRDVLQLLAQSAEGVDERMYLSQALETSRGTLSYELLAKWLETSVLVGPSLRLMGRIGSEACLEHLRAGLVASRMGVRAAALVGLGRWLKHNPEAELQWGVEEKQSASALMGHDDDEVASAAIRCMRVLGGPDSAPDVVEACALRPFLKQGLDTVSSWGEEAVAHLVDAISRLGAEARVVALEIVEIRGDRRHLDILVEIAQGPDTRAAEVAIRGMGTLGDITTVSVLEEIARTSADELGEQVWVAIERIGARFPHECAAVARARLNDGTDTASWIRVLGLLGFPQDAELIAQCVHHRSAAVRAAAFRAATSIDDSTTFETFVFAASDESPIVRAAAVAGLAGFDRTEAKTTLMACVQDPDPLVGVAAIEALSSYDDLEAARILSVAAGSTEQSLAIASLRAVFEMNPPQLKQAIERGVEHVDPEVVREAMSCTLRLPSEEARPVLLQGLTHRSWVVRLVSAQQLGKRSIRVPTDLLQKCLESEDEALVFAALEKLEVEPRYS